MSLLQVFSYLPTTISGQQSLIQGMAVSQVLSGQAPPQALLSAHKNLSLSAGALSQKEMERLIRAGLQSTAPQNTTRSPFHSIVTVDRVESFMTVDGPIKSVSRTPIQLAGSDKDSSSDKPSQTEGKKHSPFDLNTIEDAQLVVQYMEDYPELISSSLVDELGEKGFKPGKLPEIAVHTIEALTIIAISATEIEAAQAAIRTIIKHGLSHSDETIAKEAGSKLLHVLERCPDLINKNVVTAIEIIGFTPRVPFDVTFWSLESLRYIALSTKDDALAHRAMTIIHDTGLSHRNDKVAQHAANKLKEIAKHGSVLIDAHSLMEYVNEDERKELADTENPEASLQNLKKRHTRLITPTVIESLRTKGLALNRDFNSLMATVNALKTIGLLVEKTTITDQAIEVLCTEGLEHADPAVAEMSIKAIEEIAKKLHSRITTDVVTALRTKGLHPQVSTELATHTLEALQHIASPSPSVPSKDRAASEHALEALYATGLVHPDGSIAKQALSSLIYVTYERPDIVTRDDVTKLYGMYVEHQNDPMAITLREVLFRATLCNREFFTPELVKTLIAGIQEDPKLTGFEIRALVYLFNHRPELVTQELLESFDITQLIARDMWVLKATEGLAKLADERPELFTAKHVEAFWTTGLEHSYQHAARMAGAALEILEKKRPDLLPETPPLETDILEMTVQSNAENIEQFTQLEGRNIDDTGFILYTPVPLPTGLLLNLCIKLRDDRALLEAIGRIEWRNDPENPDPDFPPGIKIQFLKLSPESRLVWDEILAIKKQRNND